MKLLASDTALTVRSLFVLARQMSVERMQSIADEIDLNFSRCNITSSERKCSLGIGSLLHLASFCSIAFKTTKDHSSHTLIQFILNSVPMGVCFPLGS